MKAITSALAVLARARPRGVWGENDATSTTARPRRRRRRQRHDTTRTGTDTTDAEAPNVVRITVTNGFPAGGIVRQSVNEGDRVVIVVDSDVADEIHVHGYDLKKDVTAGGTARIPFRRDDPGALRGRARKSRDADRGADRQPVIFLAHGIGGVRDLPVPKSFFFSAGGNRARRLVRRARSALAPAAAGAAGRRAAGPTRLRPVLRSAALRIALGAVSVRASARHALGGVLRNDYPGRELRADVHLRAFWLGLPLLSVLFGNVWRVLSPWRAIADASVWVLERRRPPRAAALRRIRSGSVASRGWRSARVRRARARVRDPADPRLLGIATALYTYWALAGMAVFGRDAWTKGGEGFADEFAFLARMAPFAERDRRIVVRWPLTGLGGADRVTGTLAVIAVMLGSTSFDGFSRTTDLAEPHQRHPSRARRCAWLAGRPHDLARQYRRSRALRRSRRDGLPPRGDDRREARARASIARAGVPPLARPDCGGVRRRALLLALPDPGAVPDPARVRSARPRLGPLRDGRLRARHHGSSRRTRSGTCRSARS